MNRFKVSLAILTMIVMGFVGQSMAAGTCAYTGHIENTAFKGENGTRGLIYECTADAEDASFPISGIGGATGHITSIDVKFGTPAPSGLSFTFKTADGIGIFPTQPIAVTASSRIRATAIADGPEAFAGSIVVEVDGNTTDSAEFKVIFNVIN